MLPVVCARHVSGDLRGGDEIEADLRPILRRWFSPDERLHSLDGASLDVDESRLPHGLRDELARQLQGSLHAGRLARRAV
jgi:hypothetical protein